MQVQSISNNNYYNSTFCASKKFNKIVYEELKSRRREIVSGLAADKFDSENYFNVLCKFAVKFIESPQERRSLRPIHNYLKEYISNPEVGLKQIFNMWRNSKKLKKMINSISQENFEQKKELLFNTLREKNLGQSEVEEGTKALEKFFGVN